VFSFCQPASLIHQHHETSRSISQVQKICLDSRAPFADLHFVVYLQVIGISPITSAALVTPFLIMAGFSSTVANHIAYKLGHVRLPFLFALAVLPVGMVRGFFNLLVCDRGPANRIYKKGLMSTLSETSSIGQVVGYSLICGFGFGSVCAPAAGWTLNTCLS
jgi:hypothetical protein